MAAISLYRDNRLAAALLVCGAVGLASTQDALIKWVSGAYPAHQVLLIRCGVAFVLVGAMVHFGGGLRRLFSPLWPRSCYRGLVLGSAYLAFILAIASLPLADAVALYFTMPFFVAGLSWPMLGEKVPAHRWIAIVAGFAGVIIMNGVSERLFDPAVLLVLWSAFGYAYGQLLGRRLSRDMAPEVMAFHQNLVVGVVAAALAIGFGGMDVASDQSTALAFLTRPWAAPPPFDLAIMALLGVMAALGMVMFASAYKHGEASYVAAFEYTTMFWAVLYGILLWGDVPDVAVLSGGAIVVAAGLYMLWMDHRRAAVQATG